MKNPQFMTDRVHDWHIHEKVCPRNKNTVNFCMLALILTWRGDISGYWDRFEMKKSLDCLKIDTFQRLKTFHVITGSAATEPRRDPKIGECQI